MPRLAPETSATLRCGATLSGTRRLRWVWGGATAIEYLSRAFWRLSRAPRRLFVRSPGDRMTSTSETIRYETDGRVARLTLDRPPLNVLDLATIRALDAA